MGCRYVLHEERINTDKHFELVGDFECCNYEPLDTFLKSDSFNYDENGQGNTFVLFNEENKMVCYYTLRANSLILDNEYVPIIELARLAVDAEYARKGIGTSCIMDFIIPKILEVKKHIGAVGILVFAETKEALSFYKFIGFNDFGLYERDKNTFLITDDGFNEGCHVLILGIKELDYMI